MKLSITVITDDFGLESLLIGRMPVHFDRDVRIDDIFFVALHFRQILSADHANGNNLLNPESFISTFIIIINHLINQKLKGLLIKNGIGAYLPVLCKKLQVAVRSTSGLRM